MTTGAKGDSSPSKTSVPEGDYEKGKKLYKYRCAQCHSINTTRSLAGPTLHGVIGRTSGTAPGYVYSHSNKHKGLVWTRETLFDYLENPRKYIPGTKMSFVGLKKASDRADLVKYIEVESSKPLANS